MNKVLLKITSVILTISALFFPVGYADVHASDDVARQAEISSNYQSAYEAILNAAINNEETVSVMEYGITSNDLNEIFQDLIFGHPELFYLDGSYKYVPAPGGIIDEVYLIYNYSGAELDTAIEEFNGYIDEIISNIFYKMSDFDKVLFVHDYLATRYEYDMTVYGEHPEDAIFDAYNFFKNGRGVCQAYTGAFIAVMNRLGIESSYAASDMGNHTWNVVKLNGNWYHLDVTHDDPVSDRFGLADHKWFLKSDNVLREKFSDFECKYSCSDTSYDDAFWNDISTPFAAIGNTWYYFSGGTLYSYNSSTESKTEILTDNSKWMVWDGDGYYYTGKYYGLGVINGVLYYNTPDAIKSYYPLTGENSVVTDVDTSNGYVYGLICEGDFVKYITATSPMGENKNYFETEIQAPVWGDANGNGSVRSNDAIALKRYIVGKFPEAELINCDINKDGKITSVDVTAIKRIVCGKLVV